MARVNPSHPAPRDEHFRTCSAHEFELWERCSGKLKNGGSCSKKATVAPVFAHLPTCKIHRDQLRLASWCRAPLPCGFECKRLFEWVPHGFQLCPLHRDAETTCYLFKIPLEIRLRIYEHVFPDRDITVTPQINFNIPRFSISVLLINRQIYSEAISVLYGSRIFEIQFDGFNTVTWSATSNIIYQYCAPFGLPTLRDKQMQLMLLEQQSRKRLLNTRIHEARSHSSQAGPTSMVGSVDRDRNGSQPEILGEERRWIPPHRQQIFDLIRSFRLLIIFNYSDFPYETTDEDAAQLKLYIYTDYLHKIVERLRDLPNSLMRFEVSFDFRHHSKLDKRSVLETTKILLRPFRRLRCVTKPAIVAIESSDIEGQRRHYPASSNLQQDERDITQWIEDWCRELEGNNTVPDFSSTFKAYWELRSLVDEIRASCRSEPTLRKLQSLMHAARMARERENSAIFRAVCDQVANVWSEYLNEEKQMHERISTGIDTIYGVLDGIQDRPVIFP